MGPTPKAGLMLSMGAADLFMRPVVVPMASLQSATGGNHPSADQSNTEYSGSTTYSGRVCVMSPHQNIHKPALSASLSLPPSRRNSRA
jgi:hypothetical protein